MNMDHFENQYKKSMEGYTPEVDTESIWKNIEPRLHPKKKRRVIFLWWVAILIPGILGTWYMQTKASKTRTAAAPYRESEIPIKQSALPGTEQHTLDAGAYNVPQPLSEQYESSPPVSHLPGRTNEETSNSKDSRKKALDAGPSTPTAELIPIDVSETLSKSGPMQLSLDRLLPKEMALAQEWIPLKSHRSQASKAIKTHRSKWTPWMHAQAGLGITKKVLQNKPEIRDGGNSLSDRKGTEKMLESALVNVQWLMQHKYGFQTYVGIQYALSNERYNLAYQKTEKRTATEVIERIVDGNGQVVEEKSGLVTTTINSNYLKTTYNRYHFIDIPIGIGYALSKGRTWWSCAGGIGINLFMSFNGEQESGYGYTYQLTKGTSTYNSVYKKAVGFNGWVRAQYNWRFRPNTFLFANIQAQLPFSSLTVDDYSLNQRHWMIGGNAGLQIPLKQLGNKR